MPAEKIARKPLTIGQFALKPGDVMSDTVEALLPPGRVKVLMDQGWLAERPVVSDPMVDLSDALARIEALEAKVAVLEARRGPGRPRKVEDDGI